MKYCSVHNRVDRVPAFVLCLLASIGSFGYLAYASAETSRLDKFAAATEKTRPQPSPTASSKTLNNALEATIAPVNTAERKPPQSARATVVGSKPTYDITSVDRIQVRVLGFSDLSGEYAIDDNMVLSLPGVGRFDINGMSPQLVEDELARRISLFARRDIKVSIEISRYKPFFITGLIANPGANEWKPGLNVIKAIALAGGTTRRAAAGDDPVTSLTLQQHRTRLQFSLALLARLKAERDGALKLNNKSRMEDVIGTMPTAVQPRLREFVTRQSAMLGEQHQLALGQIAALERDRRSAERELEAAVEQENAAKAQLGITKSLTKQSDILKNKRLISNSRYLEQRSALITAQSRYAETEALTARARSRVMSVTRQIETLKRQRRADLNTRIETLEREVAQLEVSLMPSRQTNDEGEPVEQLYYTIVRETESGMVTLDATVFTLILPGDVIVLSRRRVKPDEQRNVGKSSHNNSVANAAIRLQRAIEASSLNRSMSATGRPSGDSARQ